MSLHLLVSDSLSDPKIVQLQYVISYMTHLKQGVTQQLVGGVAVGGIVVVERWSLTGELSLSCARLLVGRMITLWVRHPLSVSQHGQLSHK